MYAKEQADYYPREVCTTLRTQKFVHEFQSVCETMYEVRELPDHEVLTHLPL